ncbi:2-oxoacid:acceptor oxidoreductase subunit alpha [Thermosulfurimonas sp. F29]|uniref:2-oxoacid:acceptor oxidoreductase subunit alpha n=1 Tax=Thermosulfurimonas sp. F29 TaxID=2867247 RepID=UPI001C830572|nr:2-oxoacid:acceptor oxidoreductase subunit alpha [Thermosulfurimonas sp. F29]MBX6422734.1 2-oxoacid:acceptor oxidoreductase subunit alpha [Thermosulfurimonas sp. F29]
MSNFDFSVLFGGKAGDGIRQLGQLWARLLARRGLRVFLYDDYPSLIRGGHNFTVVRAAEFPVLAHRERVDLLVALNAFTLEKHRRTLAERNVVLFDSSTFEAPGIGVPWSGIVKDLSAPPITRNTAALASAARILGLPFEELAETLRRDLPKATEVNLEVARKSYELTPPPPGRTLPRSEGTVWPTLFGNEALALGAVAAGLRFYVAYPMTPASSILHYFARHGETLGVTTIHPENEIAAILCAMGAACAGKPAMVGTSGGGFALMVEALSLAGQAEIPIVVVECQRPGPSTGVPTYTMQADLDFVLSAGHGEFPRVVLAPGDAAQAFHLAALALKLAWHYQIPVLLLSDKHLSESLFNQELPLVEVPRVSFKSWNGEREYRRYAVTGDGISPLAFPGDPRAVVKVTSYEHDSYGITTEEPEDIVRMQDKRLRKVRGLREELDRPEMVAVEGDGERALCVWGSTRGAALEVARKLGLRYVQPLVLEPFPETTLRKALRGVRHLVVAETNATGQLARRLEAHGFPVEEVLLRYDGRPFTVEDLERRLYGVSP